MKIKTVICKINQNIFNALNRNYDLRHHALINCDSPELTMSSHLLGSLNLSLTTLKMVGGKLFYYLDLKRTRNLDDMRDSISRCFRGKVSTQTLTHIRFVDVAQIALDLNLPIEQVIYGTTDTREIARINYEHYDDMSKIARGYLALQNDRYHTVARYAKQLHTHARHSDNHKRVYRHGYTYSKIAKSFQISRQSIYNYLNGKSVLLRHKTSLQAMCEAVGKHPAEVINYPLMSFQTLRDEVKEHVTK